MKLGKLLLLLAVILIVAAAIFLIERPASKNMTIKTADSVNIAYDWYPSTSLGRVRDYLILVHMMPATKESWQDFANFAQKQGYASIAIDLRGHGQSEGGPNGFRKFSDLEHQKSILDLEAAVDYLKSQGAPADKIDFIGASIGANLSLQYLAEYPEIKKAVLLSAGLNYRGLETKPLIKKLKGDQKVLAVSSRDDDNNAEENSELFGRNYKNLVIYDRGGHGTNILENQPELKNKIIDFLND